jgi:hypothetical protein
LDFPDSFKIPGNPKQKSDFVFGFRRFWILWVDNPNKNLRFLFRFPFPNFIILIFCLDFPDFVLDFA